MQKHQEVIVLGSGLSILDLTPGQINYINNCQVTIAVNKFMAFYKESGIVPNSIYYVDFYQPSVRQFLQYIFDVCIDDNLQDLHFILNKKLRHRLASTELGFSIKRIVPSPKNVYRFLRYGKDKTLPNALRVPRKCTYDFIDHELSTVGGDWGASLNQKLFHFRGSLSTVLNFISIKYPGFPIRLVGVDFNSPKYFFQDSLNNLQFDWRDRTSDIVAREGVHFSAIPLTTEGKPGDGSTIFDKFDFITENLRRTGNSITVSSPSSLLATKKLVEFSPIPSLLLS